MVSDEESKTISIHIGKHFPDYIRAVRKGEQKGINFAKAKCLNFGSRSDIDYKYEVVYHFYLLCDQLREVILNPNFDPELSRDQLLKRYDDPDVIYPTTGEGIDFEVVESNTDVYIERKYG